MDAAEFSSRIREAIKAAQDQSRRVRNTPEALHRVRCERFQETIIKLFMQAEAVSDGFVRYRRERDANGIAKLHSLWVRREPFTNVGLFFRVDSMHLATWWQKHEATNYAHALGGWWQVPLLSLTDPEAYVQEKVLDLITTLHEEDPLSPKPPRPGSTF